MVPVRKIVFGCIDLNGSLARFFGFFCARQLLFYFITLSTQKIVGLSIEKGGSGIKKNDNFPPRPRRLTVATAASAQDESVGRSGQTNQVCPLYRCARVFLPDETIIRRVQMPTDSAVGTPLVASSREHHRASRP